MPFKKYLKYKYFRGHALVVGSAPISSWLNESLKGRTEGRTHQQLAQHQISFTQKTKEKIILVVMPMPSSAPAAVQEIHSMRASASQHSYMGWFFQLKCHNISPLPHQTSISHHIKYGGGENIHAYISSVERDLLMTIVL